MNIPQGNQLTSERVEEYSSQVEVAEASSVPGQDRILWATCRLINCRALHEREEEQERKDREREAFAKNTAEMSALEKETSKMKKAAGLTDDPEDESYYDQRETCSSSTGLPKDWRAESHQSSNLKGLLGRPPSCNR